MVKVRVLVDVDEDVVTEVNRFRGETPLSMLLGICARLGFEMLKDLVKQKRATKGRG